MGGWIKMKSMLNSTQVEAVVEVEVERGNIINVKKYYCNFKILIKISTITLQLG